MPEIEIRPATTADLPALSSISHDYETPYVWQMDRALEAGMINVSFREIRLPRSVRVEFPAALKKEIRENQTTTGILVAVLKQIMVGYIFLEENPGKQTVWIRDLVVRDNLRRQGIGTALTLAGQEFAVAHSFRHMMVEMQSKNFPGIRLVMKLGFEFCGYNDHYFANQDIALFFGRTLR
jgi:ribosomal protein S18 acetylase RimI-like enzyme